MVRALAEETAPVPTGCCRVRPRAGLRLFPFQVNPHIIPFFYHNRGRDGRPSRWRLWAGGWRGGFVLSALELWLKVA